MRLSCPRRRRAGGCWNGSRRPWTAAARRSSRWRPTCPPERLARILDAFAPSAVETPDGLSRRPRRARGIPVSEKTAVVIATSGSTGPAQGRGAQRGRPDALGARVAGPGRGGAGRPVAALPARHAHRRHPGAGPLPGRGHGAGDRRPEDAAGPGRLRLRPRLHRPDPAAAPARRPAGRGQRATWADTFKSVLLGGAAASPGPGRPGPGRAGVPVVTTYGMSETLRGLRLRRPPAGRGVGVDRGRRPDPDQRPGAVLRLPAAPGPVRGRTGRRLVRHLRPGRLDAAGQVTVRGRADDVINTGGEKVVAGEVASVLETCPGVREAVVIGRPDAEWGERVTAVIVPDNSAQPPTLDLLCSACARAPATLRCSPGTGAAGRNADAAERQTRSRNSPAGTIPGRKRY